MKKNSYFKVFIILQCIMTFLFMFEYTLGLLFSGVVMFYELFYVMVLYKSNDRKQLKILTFLSVLGFFLYEIFSKDSANLVVLLFMFFNSLFIYSYSRENDINKRGIIDLFRYLYPVMCLMFHFFGYYREITYYLIIMYPLLFIDHNKSKFDIVLIYVSTLAILIFRENLFMYMILSYLTILTLYYSFNKSKKNIEIVLPLLIISILVSVSFEGSSLFRINSRIFENELMIIKFIKALVGLFPLMYYASFYLLKLREKKYKVNNDIFILLLSMFGYLALILYTRLDIPSIIVTLVSFVFVALYKIQCNVGRRTSDKVLVITKEIDSDNVDMINGISKGTKVLSTYNNDVKNSLDVNYIINKESNASKYAKALKDRKILTIIKEGVILLANKCKEKSTIIEKLYDDNSKHLIAYNTMYGELISEYGCSDSQKIVIFDDKNDDEEYVSNLSRVLKKVDYLLFETKKMEEIYKDKVDAKTSLYDKKDKKQLNNLTK